MPKTADAASTRLHDQAFAEQEQAASSQALPPTERTSASSNE